MPDTPRACHECGWQGEAAEFQKRRIKQPRRSGKGKVFLNVWLCSECVGRYDDAPAKLLGRCDRCGAAIGDGAGHLRSHTETEQAGNLVRHQTMNMILCPEYAASYDGTGGHLLKGLGIIVGVLLFLACAGWLLSPR